jgi:hypothetical protein
MTVLAMTKSRRSRARTLAELEASDSDRRFALLVAMLVPERAREARTRSGGATQEREVSMDNERPVVDERNEDRVRAGVTGHNVRYVLFGSIALVIILFIIVWLVMRP